MKYAAFGLAMCLGWGLPVTNVVAAPAQQVASDEVLSGVIESINAARTQVVIDGRAYQLTRATRVGEVVSYGDKAAPLARGELEEGIEVFYYPQGAVADGEVPVLQFIYRMVN